MNEVSRLGRLSGIMLAVAGVFFFIAGALHPQGSSAPDLRGAYIELMRSPTWAVAHWFAVISLLLLAWAVWLVVDAGWTRDSISALAGARLAIISSLFVAIASAAEIAAAGTVEEYAAGRPSPLIGLLEPMEAMGWPAHAVGFVLLAVGMASLVPRLVTALGVIGAVAMGLGGILVEGLGLVPAGPLYAGGAALAVWMVWLGVQLARSRRTVPFRSTSRRASGAEAAP